MLRLFRTQTPIAEYTAISKFIRMIIFPIGNKNIYIVNINQLAHKLPSHLLEKHPIFSKKNLVSEKKESVCFIKSGFIFFLAIIFLHFTYRFAIFI